MTDKWSTRLANRVRIYWKLCLSFGKRDWGLRDYPVSIRAKELDPEYISARFKQHRYMAHIANWGLAGSGDTREAAICDLNTTFEAVKAERKQQGTSLPRPGVQVPIEFASRERVSAHEELSDDFIRRILELDWAWISDDSSLWDFHLSETNESLYVKIKDVYGVDVSDIESARLSEILDRIASAQSLGFSHRSSHPDY